LVQHPHRGNKGLLVMSLKQFANNKQAMDEFNELIDELISTHHRTMEQAGSVQEVYSAQGAISTLRRLKLLKEIVNG
jgi:hypothetical protein